MSDARLLGFLSGEPRATNTLSSHAWPLKAPSPEEIRVTQTATPQPLLEPIFRENIREWFKATAAEWTRETGAHSSMTIRRRHPAYKEIVAVGWPVVPLLLRALREMPDMWFAALREITNENPVAPDDRGHYDKMSESWLAWGREKHLIA